MRSCNWVPIEKDFEIRLLQIQPEQRGNSRVKCSISAHPRDSTPSYEALSYTWGDSRDLEIIQCDGKDLFVTKTCASALRALRQRNAAALPGSLQPKYVWIDAICINQQDLAERSAQVAIMGSIFRCAQKTVVYLGEIDKHAKWMQRYVFSDDEDVPRYTSLNSRAKHWKEFFGRAWFTRTWIIQEVLNTVTKLVVLLGSEEMPWSMLEAANTRIGTLFKQDWNFAHESNVRIPQIVSIRDQLSSMSGRSDKDSAFVDVLTTRFLDTPLDGCPDVDGDSGISKLGISFSKLLYVLDQTSTFRCTDGRDKLFAILPLFQRPIPWSLQPDYSKTLAEVYTDLAWYFINHNVCSVIQFLRTPDHDESLPSWVIDWRHDTLISTWTLLQEPQDPHLWQGIFKARERRLYARRDGRILNLKGMVVSRIDICNPEKGTVRWKDGTDYNITAVGLALPGDFIVFCLGFPQPFVLRQRFNGDWELVGTCYFGDGCSGYSGWSRAWQEYAEKVQRGSLSFLTDFRIC